MHKRHEDRYLLLHGEMLCVFYDEREDSSTSGLVATVVLSHHNRRLMNIPIGVWHATKNIGDTDLMCLNFPTHPYEHTDPDKYRLPARHGPDSLHLVGSPGLVAALPTSDAPLASVVVATTRDASRLLRCLASIERGAGDVPYEVVLVLSGADDDVVEAARTVGGVRLVESRWNLGFAGAWNAGRAEARGELIVSLHDDAEAEEGWLPALVDAAERHPDAGVIGGRVLNGDSGRLQLAGGVMFSDGRSALLGRGEAADAPEHMAPRAIDYSSSCSLLVRAQTWDSIGGADELMFPGGYVDADLSMAAWAAGWTVRYEPSAVVRHRHLGTMTADFKAFTHGRNRKSLPRQVGGRARAARAVGAGRGRRRGPRRRARGSSRRVGSSPVAGRTRRSPPQKPADPDLGSSPRHARAAPVPGVHREGRPRARAATPRVRARAGGAAQGPGRARTRAGKLPLILRLSPRAIRSAAHRRPHRADAGRERRPRPSAEPRQRGRAIPHPPPPLPRPRRPGR